MKSLAVAFRLSDDDIDRLITSATAFGFHRQNPQKAWTDRERIEAVRFAIRRHIGNLLKGKS